MTRRQFAVLGLGRFGSSVATTLFETGHEVLGVDKDEDKVQQLASVLTHVIEADTTDERALRRIGIPNFDAVIVAIGEDIQSNILTTLTVKELGAQRVVAKAQNEMHEKVLFKIGADQVIRPERDMGIRVARALADPSVLENVPIAPGFSLLEVEAPDSLTGRLGDLRLPARFKVNVIATNHRGKANLSPNADTVIESGDMIVISGDNEALDALRRFISK